MGSGLHAQGIVRAKRDSVWGWMVDSLQLRYQVVQGAFSIQSALVGLGANVARGQSFVPRST